MKARLAWLNASVIAMGVYGEIRMIRSLSYRERSTVDVTIARDQ